MVKYNTATIGRKSGKRNLHAFVTVPMPLREILKRKQIVKSLGTTDVKIANSKLRDVEAEIWKEFDQANEINHPLVKAWIALELETQRISSPKEPLSQYLNYAPTDIFDVNIRYEIEEELRNRAGYVLGHPITGDLEEDMAISHAQSRIEPLMYDFLDEFRKLNKLEYAPTKRSKRFAEIVDEYHNHPTFKLNKEHEPKRKKTLVEEINKVAKFISWAGDVAIDDFDDALFNSYLEALVDPKLKLINSRKDIPGLETLKGHIKPVVGVLGFALRKGYTKTKLWHGLNYQSYGLAKKSYRDILEPEVEKLFKMDMPEPDRLCLILLFVTGARLDEIGTLTWDKIKEENLNGKTITWIETFDSVVKNKQSRRAIPIHQTAQKLMPKRGTGWNKKDPNRLFDFPLDADGKCQNKASQRLMSYIYKLRKDENDDRLAIHSLRHTFSTMCRNSGIEFELREFIVGRGGRGGSSTEYGQVHAVETKLNEINKLDVSAILGT